MSRYYAVTPSGPVFQIRVPKSLAQRLSFSCLSFPIAHGSRQVVRDRALKLAATAKDVFAMLDLKTEAELANLCQSELKEIIWRTALEPFPAGLSVEELQAARHDRMALQIGAAHELVQRPVPIRSPQERMRSLPLRGQVAVIRAHQQGKHLINEELDEALMRVFQAAMSDEALQRKLAGRIPFVDHELPVLPAAPGAGEPAAAREDLPVAKSASVCEEPVTQYRFSDAIGAYCDDLTERKGSARNENVSNLKLRAKMFHALCGDPALSEITNATLREFGYAISYLPADIARAGDWTPETLPEILRDNGYIDRSKTENSLK